MPNKGAVQNMRYEKAIVIKVDGDFASLAAEPSESCEHCVLKELCLGNTEGKLKAINTANAEEGDLVEFEIDILSLNKKLILISSIGLILLFAGALIGYYINPFKINPSLSGGIFALVFSFLTFPLLKGEKFSSKGLYPEIKRIIRREK